MMKMEKRFIEEAYLDNFRIFSDLGYSIKPTCKLVRIT
jgi:hypothetical protein